MAPDGPPKRGRNAEHTARRTSSCAFADNVACAAMRAYDAARASLPDQDPERGQTVLAAVVARDARHDPPMLRVVSLAAGTKFLSGVDIAQDETTGAKLRDCHAEVLARRGMKRFLYAQITDARANERIKDARRGRDEAETQEKHSTPWNVLVRSMTDTNTDTDTDTNGDTNTDPNTDKHVDAWHVCDSVSFHLYASSAPCGNACVKRWAKGGREIFCDTVCEMDVPPETHEHGTPLFGAVRDGQLAFLWKRDPDEAKTNESNAGSLDKTPRRDTIVVPPGCSTVGKILTCSDKIAVWSCVGCQGALLLSPGLLHEPVYFESVVVGRKFSKAVSRRAICCRVRKVFENNKRSNDRTKFKRTKHPAVLCTAVPFDMTTYAEGEGAVFDGGRALVAWREKESENEKSEHPSQRDELPDDAAFLSDNWQIELVDGRSGTCVTRIGGDQENRNNSVSGVARAALLAAHAQSIESLEKRNEKAKEENPAVTYVAMKTAAGSVSGYAQAKRDALSQPGLWVLATPHRNATVR